MLTDKKKKKLDQRSRLELRAKSKMLNKRRTGLAMYKPTFLSFYIRKPNEESNSQEMGKFPPLLDVNSLFDCRQWEGGEEREAVKEEEEEKGEMVLTIGRRKGP